MKRGTNRGSVPTSKKKAILARDGNNCYYCHVELNSNDYRLKTTRNKNGDIVTNFEQGETFPTAEHLVPVVDGGSNDIDNLVLTCRPCNTHRGHMPMDEWLSCGWLCIRRQTTGYVKRSVEIFTDWQIYEM